MISGSASRRYAPPSWASDNPQDNLESLTAEVGRLASAIEHSADLRTVLLNPAFTQTQRQDVLGTVCQRLALSKTSQNLALLLLSRGRVANLPGIARSLRQMVDEVAGRVRVRLTSARPLDAAAETRIRSALGNHQQDRAGRKERRRVADRWRRHPSGRRGLRRQPARRTDQPARTLARGSYKVILCHSYPEWRYRCWPPGAAIARAAGADMELRAEEISPIIRKQIEDYDQKVSVQETSTVLMAGDGIARVYGLSGAMAGETLDFPHGIKGMVLNLEEDNVGVALLGNYELIREGDVVKRTGQIASVPVGKGLLGRVVNALGQPVDGKRPASVHRVAQSRSQGARHRLPQVGPRADADRHQGHRRDDPRRSWPA